MTSGDPFGDVQEVVAAKIAEAIVTSRIPIKVIQIQADGTLIVNYGDEASVRATVWRRSVSASRSLTPIQVRCSVPKRGSRRHRGHQSKADVLPCEGGQRGHRPRGDAQGPSGRGAVGTAQQEEAVQSAPVDFHSSPRCLYSAAGGRMPDRHTQAGGHRLQPRKALDRPFTGSVGRPGVGECGKFLLFRSSEACPHYACGRRRVRRSVSNSNGDGYRDLDGKHVF